jgi:SSS family solute:Na+ symporter
MPGLKMLNCLMIGVVSGKHGLHVLDYVVVISYLALMVLMGVIFSKRQKSTARYFKAEGTIPAWAVGISLMAALISSITFIAYPGAAYEKNWILLVQGLMVPIVLIFLIWFIVPMYRQIIGLSTYEYFEKRFSYLTRLYTSLGFSIMHFTKMGTVFYLLAVALYRMTGWDHNAVITILGIIVIIYTLIGGIEAVIWCDVIQGIMLMGGGIVCVLVLLFTPQGGPAAVISTAWANGKMSMGPLGINNGTLDLVNTTFIVMALNGIFYAIQKYGTDQTIVQRFLVAKSDKQAIKATLIGILLCVPVWTTFMFIGACLWSYYKITGNPLPEGIKPDGVFPYFIMSQLPYGVTGLILAALMAAALSSLDSDLNCLSAVVVEDYYRHFRPNSSDKQRLVMGRIVVVLCGIGAMLIAYAYVMWSDRSVLGIVFELYAIFSAGIAGLFALGFLTKRANKKGIYVGIIACIIFTAWAFLSSLKIENPDGTKSVLLNLNKIFGSDHLNFTHSKYMLGVYSHLVLFSVGYVASFFFRHEKPTDHLTYYGWRKTHKKLAELAAEQK